MRKGLEWVCVLTPLSGYASMHGQTVAGLSYHSVPTKWETDEVRLAAEQSNEMHQQKKAACRLSIKYPRQKTLQYRRRALPEST
jgi:hypothetical protein